MKKKWTKQEVEMFVEANGGDAFNLLTYFPFSDNAMREIEFADADVDNVTDNELADLIYNIAYGEAE